MNNLIINSKQNEILTEVFNALEFAAYKHRHQKRKGAGEIPYINHPIEVTHLILRTVVNPARELIIAALLHDILEDTDTTADEITEHFGERALKIVEEVTDDMELPRKERKKLQVLKVAGLSTEAKYIKIADKACNIKDIINTRLYWTKRAKVEYIEWACSVVGPIKHIHEGLTNAFLENIKEAETRLNHKFSFTV